MNSIILQDIEGNYPLHAAIHGSCLQTVQLCLEAGARISRQQQDLSTAVHLGFIATFCVFLKNIKFTCVQLKYIFVILGKACSQGGLEIVKLMFTVSTFGNGFGLHGILLTLKFQFLINFLHSSFKWTGNQTWFY